MLVDRIMYHVKEGIRSIFTHGLMSFAATCMIIACLLIMGSFSLIAVNTGHMLRDLENENEFLAYVDEDFTTQQAQGLQASIESIENVSTVTFVTREEAMADFKADKENAALFSDLPAEVLRDRYRIHVDDIELMAETTQAVQSLPGVAKVQASLEIADGFVMLRNVASALAVILVVMLVVISLFIIANTIRLTTFTRRDEIAIMKMCGATDWFVRWPFLVEGVVLGIVGALIACLLQWGIYHVVQGAMERSGILQLITMVPFGSIASRVLLVFLLAGFAIGAGGSAMAIRRFLKV